MKPIERRRAREYALQAMYQWHVAKAPIEEIETQFITQHISEKTDIIFFKDLLHGIPKNLLEIDNLMTPFLKRPLTELDPVELSILRLGVYELKERLDIPYRVAINEALELTKKFGSIEGFKFVNGVLDQIAKRIRQHEITAEKK